MCWALEEGTRQAPDAGAEAWGVSLCPVSHSEEVGGRTGHEHVICVISQRIKNWVLQPPRKHPAERQNQSNPGSLNEEMIPSTHSQGGEAGNISEKCNHQTLLCEEMKLTSLPTGSRDISLVPGDL